MGFWTHDSTTCPQCKYIGETRMEMDEQVPILGTTQFICTKCFVRFPRTENHDCFIAANPPDLNHLWDQQNPDFTPFDDRPLSIGQFIELQKFIDDQGWR